VNRPKTTKYSKENPSPALMYIHGGGAIALEALQSDEPCQRWADENDVVVFNLEYRLAPETPAPGGIMDCYAALKYILANAEKHNVDPKRVTFTGDSGGGYLSMGLAMTLSQRNESELVPFCIGSACMVGSNQMTRTPEQMQKYEHAEMENMMFGTILNAIAGVDPMGPFEGLKDRADVLITNMSEDVAKNMPPIVLFSSEFDSCRWGTEEMAQLLVKHGKLLDYIVHPGTGHCWYMGDHENKSPSTKKCWDDFGKVFQKYLIKDQKS